MSEEEHVLFEIDDGVGVVTLNRPDRMNAVHWDMAEQLVNLFRDMRQNDDVRTVVLTGAGGRALAVACDIRDEAQVDAMIAQTIGAFGRLDLLRRFVYRAGQLGGRVLRRSGCADDVHPIPRQRERDVASDATRGAGDDCDSCFGHCVPFWFQRVLYLRASTYRIDTSAYNAQQ